MTRGAQAASLILLLLAARSPAAVPTLEALHPAGGERGSTNSITLVGKFDPWPPKIWIDVPGVEFRAQTNKAKVDVIVAADAIPGPRLVRVYNDEGASEARLFVVGDGVEEVENEPNNYFARAQQVANLPMALNGRLEKSGDVDSFAIGVRAGQWLDARVDSYTLMSKVDAILRLVTTNGQQLAWNHDFATLDPRLVWQSTHDQTVVVQIYGFPHPATASVKLHGGEAAIYRLHLAVTESMPLARSHSSHATNHTHNPPFTCGGRIEAGNEEDNFSFAAMRDSVLEFKVSAADVGSSLDAWLKIEDSAGSELARNDDAEGTRDPSLEWKCPSNGTYRVVIGSVTHRGGLDYHYNLSVQPVAPDCRATLAANALAATAGTTNAIKLNLKRLRGYTNELAVEITGLPENASSPSTNLSAKVSGEVSLPIIVATNAAAFSGPIQVKLKDAADGRERVVAFNLTSRTEDNGVPGGYSALLVEQLAHVWLTVKAKPPEPAKEAADK